MVTVTSVAVAHFSLSARVFGIRVDNGNGVHLPSRKCTAWCSWLLSRGLFVFFSQLRACGSVCKYIGSAVLVLQVPNYSRLNRVSHRPDYQHTVEEANFKYVVFECIC